MSISRLKFAFVALASSYMLAGAEAALAQTTMSAKTATQQPSAERPAAQDSDRRPPHEPPPQAYVDCKGKKEGDTLTISPPGRDKVPATCVSSAKGLYARPQRPPAPPSREDMSSPTKK